MGVLLSIFWIFLFASVFLCPLAGTLLALYVISKIEKTSIIEVIDEYIK